MTPYHQHNITEEEERYFDHSGCGCMVIVAVACLVAVIAFTIILFSTK